MYYCEQDWVKTVFPFSIYETDQ